MYTLARAVPACAPHRRHPHRRHHRRHHRRPAHHHHPLPRPHSRLHLHPTHPTRPSRSGPSALTLARHHPHLSQSSQRTCAQGSTLRPAAPSAAVAGGGGAAAGIAGTDTGIGGADTRDSGRPCPSCVAAAVGRSLRSADGPALAGPAVLLSPDGGTWSCLSRRKGFLRKSFGGSQSQIEGVHEV